MAKFISNLFLGALALLLSIFTASRTLDLLAWALPAGQVIYQWLGLAAYEGGMYFWSFYFVSGAKGVQQRSIALIMAVFSVLAVCIATIVDLSLGAAEAGKIAPLSPGMQQAMIVFVGVTVALNVAAFLACKLMSPEKLREIASGQAEDLIYAEGLRAISSIAPEMAAEAAPHLAAEWSNRTWQKIVPGVKRTTYVLPPASSAPAALPAGNVQPPDYISNTLPDPARVPAPSSVPASAPKKRGFLGFLAGKKAAPAPVFTGRADQAQELENAVNAELAPATLSQEAPAPARPARRPAPAPASSVAASRRARRAARFQSKPAAAPEPAAPAPDEHRMCSECGAVLDLKNAKQLTCSPACRKARARRLASRKKAEK
jgi:hypothetical protein